MQLLPIFTVPTKLYVGCKSDHILKKSELLVKGSQETGMDRARAYRSSSCLSLEMEKGMSPYSKLPDKSLQRQEKTETNLKIAHRQRKGGNTIKEDLA